MKVELQLYDQREVTDECAQCTRWPAANAATAVRCFQLLFLKDVYVMSCSFVARPRFQHDIPLVGRDPTEYSRQILTEPVYFFTGAEEREIVLDGIESMSFSGFDYDTELNRSRKV